MNHFLSATNGRTKSNQHQLTSNSSKGEQHSQFVDPAPGSGAYLTGRKQNNLPDNRNSKLLFIFIVAYQVTVISKCCFVCSFYLHSVSLFHAYRVTAPFGSGLLFSPHEQNLSSTSSCSLFFEQTYAKRLYKDREIHGTSQTQQLN